MRQTRDPNALEGLSSSTRHPPNHPGHPPNHPHLQQDERQLLRLAGLPRRRLQRRRLLGQHLLLAAPGLRLPAQLLISKWHLVSRLTDGQRRQQGHVVGRQVHGGGRGHCGGVCGGGGGQLQRRQQLQRRLLSCKRI